MIRRVNSFIFSKADGSGLVAGALEVSVMGSAPLLGGLSPTSPARTLGRVTQRRIGTATSALRLLSASVAGLQLRGRIDTAGRTMYTLRHNTSQLVRSSGFFFLPRRFIGLLRWSRRSRGYVCPDERVISEPLADNTSYRVNEPGHVLGLAVIEPIHLLIEVAEQMERLHGNVGSLNAPLQQAPEVLQPVGVDVALGVALSVVNHLMDELLIQLLVGVEVVSENLGSWLAGRVDGTMQGAATDRAKDASADAAGLAIQPVTLQQTDNRSLARWAGGGNHPLLLVLVHKPRATADVGLVNLNLPLHALGEGLGLHGQPDTVEHEPGGFLGHPKSAVQLVATDTVLGVDQEPDRGEPLVEADRRILKDRPEFDAELLATALALPDAASGQERVLIGATAGAGHTIGPAETSQERQAHVRIGEVPNGLNQRSRCSDGRSVHAFNIRQRAG
jgi:hypothetical protein